MNERHRKIGETGLIQLIQDSSQSAEARAEGCSQLGLMKSRRAVPVLLEIGSKEKSELLFWESLKAVGTIGSKRATRPLMRLIRTTESRSRMTAAVLALLPLGDERAASLLIRIMLHGKDTPKARGLAAEALGWMRPKRDTLVALRKALEDPSEYLRYSAVCACSGLRSRAMIPALGRLLTDEAELPGEGTIAQLAREVLQGVPNWPK